MKILISNDDGIFAEGINVLAEVLADIAEVIVVAPDRNRSAASNSLTLQHALHVREVKPNWLSVEGTPADCTHFALSEHLKDNLPDLIVTGINHGANLGDDTIYSGTVASAMEGHFLDIPAIAVSLTGRIHFATAARVVKAFIQEHLEQLLATKPLLNINVPDISEEELQGTLITRLGQRKHSHPMYVQTNPRGEKAYWLGPPGEPIDKSEGTDFWAIEHHYVSVTPLQKDLTDHSFIHSLQQWTSKK